MVFNIVASSVGDVVDIGELGEMLDAGRVSI